MKELPAPTGGELKGTCGARQGFAHGAWTLVIDIITSEAIAEVTPIQPQMTTACQACPLKLSSRRQFSNLEGRWGC